MQSTTFLKDFKMRKKIFYIYPDIYHSQNSSFLAVDTRFHLGLFSCCPQTYLNFPEGRPTANTFSLILFSWKSLLTFNFWKIFLMVNTQTPGCRGFIFSLSNPKWSLTLVSCGLSSLCPGRAGLLCSVSASCFSRGALQLFFIHLTMMSISRILFMYLVWICGVICGVTLFIPLVTVSALVYSDTLLLLFPVLSF